MTARCRTLLVTTMLVFVLALAGIAGAQQPAPESRPGTPAPRQDGQGGMDHRQHHSGPMRHMGPGGQMPMMCSMMGMGGMMGGMGGGQMMREMDGMGGMPMPPPTDPKAMGQWLQLRGELMKAMGDVMLKHGKMMEGSGR